MTTRPVSAARIVEGKSYEEILANSTLSSDALNLYPLSGRIPISKRVAKKTLGEGSFGRVNLEMISESEEEKGRVATKYSLRNTSKDYINYDDIIAELAVLKYLKGFPYVAQLVGISNSNTIGVKLGIPALIMGYAPNNLSKRVLYTSWDDLLHTVIGVLQGYNTLHSLDIIHRDTKPANMLMTARKEVLITDFGMSRYNPLIIPPCQDGYMGTYWYASPEVLIKGILNKKIGVSVKYTSEGWRAHDAWAVGASLYDILVSRPLFYGNMETQIIQRIYDVKGEPVPEDGEMSELTKMLGELETDGTLKAAGINPFTFPEETITISDHVIERTVFIPSADRKHELETVSTIIEGLLTYNPKTRLTIQGAIDLLVTKGLIRAEEPLIPPTLFSMYRNTSTIIIKKLITMLFNWLDLVCKEGKTFLFSKNTRPIVFDRACIYMLQLLSSIEITRKTFQGYGTLCLTIAGDLFDENESGFTFTQLSDVRHITDKAYNFPELKDYMNNILISPIQYLGETYYDRMMKNASTDEHRERAANINKMCLVKSIYHDFALKLTPEQISEVLTSIMTGTEEITEITEKTKDEEKTKKTENIIYTEFQNKVETLMAKKNKIDKRGLNREALLHGNLSILNSIKGGRSTHRRRYRKKRGTHRRKQ
jgi:serine/threonine protein kinase